MGGWMSLIYQTDLCFYVLQCGLGLGLGPAQLTSLFSILLSHRPIIWFWSPIYVECELMEIFSVYFLITHV